MSDHEEATPVGPVATRQRAAFAALVEQYQQQLGSYLIHLIGNQQVALTVTEETFVCAHHADLASRPATTVGAWLYGVATRLAYRHLRKIPPAQFALHRLERMTVDRASPRDREGAVVETALWDLLPSERAVLLLCDLEQRPVAEAAAILGTSTGRVQRKLARARAGFRFACLASHAVVSPNLNGSTTS